MVRFMRDPVGYHLALVRRYGDPFVLPLPGLKMVVTGRAEVIRQVLSMDREEFDVLDIGTEILGEHALVRLNGEEHRRARAQVGPLVMDPLRHGNGTGIAEITRRLILTHAGGRRVRMIDLAKRITLETILRSVLNLTDPASVEAFAAAFATMQSKASFLLHFAGWLQLDLGPWSPWGRVRRARRLIDATIAEALRTAADLPGDDAGPIGAIARDAFTASTPLDGPEALRHQVYTLLSAGHASTAQALAWAVHHVYGDPVQRERLRAEVDQLGGERTVERIARLPYLDAFCREVLRLRPIGPIIGRKLARPMEIGGWRLPAGTVIGLSVGLAHQDPDSFTEPLRFNPDRYLKSEDATGARHSDVMARSIPFGGGVRHCLGAALGLIELKIVLAELVAAFDVELCDRAVPTHRLIDVVAGPVGGVPVQIRDRTATD
jgi:cytochrome P450